MNRDYRNKALNDANTEWRRENQRLRERWEGIKDLLKLSIDMYDDSEDFDMQVYKKILDEMERAEGIKKSTKAPPFSINKRFG
jgi:hypothetical protein